MQKGLVSRLLNYSYQLEMALEDKDNMADFLEDKEIWFREIKQVLDEAASEIEFEKEQMDKEKFEELVYEIYQEIERSETA